MSPRSARQRSESGKQRQQGDECHDGDNDGAVAASALIGRERRRRSRFQHGGIAETGSGQSDGRLRPPTIEIQCRAAATDRLAPVLLRLMRIAGAKCSEGRKRKPSREASAITDKRINQEFTDKRI